MRSLPKKTNRTPTETQALQRQLFTTVSEFLSPLSPVVSLYFGRTGGVASRRNQAMSYHMREAVEYVEPDFDILYNKVMISKGDLVGVQNPAIVPQAGRKLAISWEDNSGQGSAKPDDKLVVVVYALTAGLYYTDLNVGRRNAVAKTITLPDYFAGLAVHTWVTFASEDDKSYASSVYLGEATLI